MFFVKKQDTQQLFGDWASVMMMMMMIRVALLGQAEAGSVVAK